ncbi:MAG: hypothetical protein R2873_06435 [Caldilineaceae bacterium]
MSQARRLELDQPAQYTIQVQGRLSDHWLSTLAPLAVTVDLDEYETTVTTLRVAVLDQAALQGLLRTLYSLGLPLVSVRLEKSDL